MERERGKILGLIMGLVFVAAMFFNTDVINWEAVQTIFNLF